MKPVERVALALVAALAVATAAELVAVGVALSSVKADGAKLRLPSPLPAIDLKPGKVSPIELPADATAALENMHAIAGVAALVAVVVVVAVTG